MRSILNITLRFFSKNKFITISSIMSVFLSVSLIISMTLFAINAKQSLREEVTKIYGDMDISVGYEYGNEKYIDTDFIKQINSNPSIESTSNVLISQFTLNSFKSNTSIYSIGVNNNSLAKSRYHFTEDIGLKEIIVNEGLATALNIHVGDEVIVENEKFTLIETVKDLKATGIAPDMLILPYETAKSFIKEENDIDIEATYVLIEAKENVNKVLLANDLKNIDNGLRVDVVEEDPFLVDNLGSLSIFVVILSFLILIVTSLLIISNFEVFLYKYKNQFSIMRSIGATTKQLFFIILVQSSFIIILGAIMGFCFTLGINKYSHIWLEKIFSFSVSNNDFNYKIALIITIISSSIIQLFLLLPAIRNSKTLPMKVMQSNEELDFKFNRSNKLIGKILFISSILIILFGKFVPREEINQVYSLLLAAILFTVALFLVFPIYLSPILNRIAPFLRKLIGDTSYISIRNVIPQVKKNTFVILTISTMMIIAVFGSVMLNTIQKNEAKYLKSQFPTDIVLKSRLGLDTNLDPLKLEKISRKYTQKEETNVSFISTKSSGEMLNGNSYITFDYALGDLEGLEEMELITELPQELKSIIVVSEEFANSYDLNLGDKVELGIYSEEDEKVMPTGEYSVGAISNKLHESDVYFDWGNKDYKTKFTVFYKLYLDTKGNEETLESLEEIKIQFPEIQINNYVDSLNKSNEMFYQRWSIFIFVMFVILFSVIIGVFNTLINNINSKRKEFAILRAISITRTGIINLIITQVIIYILIGLILGGISGTMLTLIISLIDPGRLYINYSIIAFLTGSMIILALIIFIPFSLRLGNRKISLELNEDNK
ncbi:ABC transporter permease [Rossellomorea vietnamensis]|uniref:ABC transporter permease n=1 Tax=Rossellomorea vietnamensis TaxID=218284 RepID=UPI001E5EADFA|nr:ABC transporter permease [Rossellomorea vietnamensis]MCC5801900.1 ABC transporter permease [Rossellomorea vietnamensis]